MKRVESAWWVILLISVSTLFVMVVRTAQIASILKEHEGRLEHIQIEVNNLGANLQVAAMNASGTDNKKNEATAEQSVPPAPTPAVPTNAMTIPAPRRAERR